MDKLYLALSVITAALCGGLIWKFYYSGKPPHIDINNAEKAKEKKQNEIENTPASDLVDAAPDADELRADAAGIVGRAKQRLRDRIGDIISRFNGSGDPGGGGS
jgi:hypothetical protein